MEYYAHSTENSDKSGWQLLIDHLEAVACLAEEFAAVFEAGEWGYIAGLLHDQGKATVEFQRRLEGSMKRVDHSTFGARLAKEYCGRLGLLLSYVIAGHHGGVPNGGFQEGELHYRLKNGRIPADVIQISKIDKKELILPFRLSKENFPGFHLAFFARMLFSCLVDADFLDTERFCSPIKNAERSGYKIPNLSVLKDKLDSFLDELTANAKNTAVNVQRNSILQQCQSKARLSAQFFSLSVPTGGGKTLSSLAFAFDHAIFNGMRRIIYAIPFTSIIEQNAAVFQNILGRDAVLEHHCNYKEIDDEGQTYNRHRGLTIENWDAPVVVTTNVQFFESLFSNRPSRCRKLHNIAGSVIILDEAQAIPTEYLEPCLLALRVLVEDYNCSVVLCTATQPALDDQQSLKASIPYINEIIDNPKNYYEALQRTQVEFIGAISDTELAQCLNANQQVLCIASTKAQARSVFEKVDHREGVYHLSTNMYPEHRRRCLAEIRERLKATPKQPCTVISTSLVEAGVDLDFPVVYRAMAGLDSIAQAAGRCNREGLLNNVGQLGRVYVFLQEVMPRMPWLKRCISRAEETLRSLPNEDPLGPIAMRRYFELLYDVEDADKKQIVKCLNPPITPDLAFLFRDVADEFRFIADESIGVIIPCGEEIEEMINQLEFIDHPRVILRKLQHYSVSVRSKICDSLVASGAVEMVAGKFPVLRNMAAYNEKVGLCVDQGEVWNPEDFLC